MNSGGHLGGEEGVSERFSRRYYHRSHCRRGFAPLGRQLGVDRHVTTPAVRRWIARLAARDTFPEATVTLFKAGWGDLRSG
jgi:hypothetical protein